MTISEPIAQSSIEQGAVASPVAPRLARTDLLAIIASLSEEKVIAARVAHSPDATTRSQEHARRRLVAIHSAYRRLLDGAIDVCARCHGPIPVERLKLVSYTDRCLLCATETSGRAPYIETPSVGAASQHRRRCDRPTSAAAA